jgi:hypothetical protein
VGATSNWAASEAPRAAITKATHEREADHERDYDEDDDYDCDNELVTWGEEAGLGVELAGLGQVSTVVHET